MSPKESPMRIARLFVYPVKSCAGIALDESLLLDTGLDLDRAWMVVDEHGEFVSQREQPRLALVQPQFKRGGSELVLRAAGMLALHLAVDVVEEPVRVRVWDDEVKAYDMGDIAAQWFTDFLSLTPEGLPGAGGARYRLVRFDPDERRLSSPTWTQGLEAPNQFSDGFPLLVLGQASLEELNTRLQAAGHARVGIERFRPNIVLTGLAAHEEDQLDRLQVDGGDTAVVLRLVKPCARCGIPDIDPLTAQPGRAVSEALRGYRQDARLKGALTFGMNAIVQAGAESMLRVGQIVQLGGASA
ncbi:MAG: MOSC domain-containing protein [Hylemonella sp.]